MTIRLLTRWNDFDANSIISSDAATEAGLIAARMAVSDLTGGERRYHPVSAPSAAPVQQGLRSMQIGSGEQVPVTIPANYRLIISAGAGATGVVEFFGDASEIVTRRMAISTGPNLVGPFPNDRRVRVSSNAGTLTMLTERVRNERAGDSSVMFLGSSTFAAGSQLPNLPKDSGVLSINPVLTAINVNGQFLQRTYLAQTASTAAGGVLRYRASDSTLSWQAAGDAEGPRVLVSPAHMWYTLPSATAGAELYMEVIPRLAPPTDVTLTFPAPISNFYRYENVSAFGLAGLIQILGGSPYATTISFAKSSATLADMRAAHADWEDVYTDLTHIYMGTNDVSSRDLALRALEDIEFIVRSRMALGSRVVVGCILPVNGRSTAALQAVAEFNLGLRTMGENLGFVVWDAWPYVAAPNGDWVAGFSEDGTHMTPATCYLVAKRVVLPAMRSLLRGPMPTIPVMAAYDPVTAPSGNLLPNAIMAGTAQASANSAAATGTVPTSWAAERMVGSTITMVCTAPDAAGATPLSDGRQGKYFTVAVNNAGTGAVNGETIRVRRSNATVMPGIAAGDVVVLEGALRAQGTGIQSITVSLVDIGVGLVTSFVIQGAGGATGLVNLDGDTLRMPFRSAPLKLREGLTNVQVYISVAMLAGGTMTLDIEPNMNLHKVPAN